MGDMYTSSLSNCYSVQGQGTVEMLVKYSSCPNFTIIISVRDRDNAGPPRSSVGTRRVCSTLKPRGDWRRTSMTLGIGIISCNTLASDTALGTVELDN